MKILFLENSIFFSLKKKHQRKKTSIRIDIKLIRTYMISKACKIILMSKMTGYKKIVNNHFQLAVQYSKKKNFE